MTLKVFSEGAWPFQDIVEFKEEELFAVLAQGVKCCKIYEVEFVKKKSLKISYLDSRVRWIYYFDESIESKNPQTYL